MAYDLSTIKLGVSLKDTKQAVDQLDALVKQLETKKVKLSVDIDSIKAGVEVATKEIQKAYDEQANAAKKADEKTATVKKQSHEDAMKYLREQQAEIKKVYGADSKLTFNQNSKTKQITSAMISFSNKVGEAETRMFRLKESMGKIEDSGKKIKHIKLSPITEKMVDDAVKVNKEIDKIAFNTQKVKDNISDKMIKATNGNEWVKGLPQFNTVDNMLKNFNPSSSEQLKQNAYEIGKAFKELQVQINKVKVGDSISEDINKASESLLKFKESMNVKIDSIKVGSNGDWATNLKQFEELSSKMNEINSLKINPQNMDDISNKIKEVNSLYNQTVTEITRVNQLNQELTSKNAFDNNVSASIQKYNQQLDGLINKNSQLANNPAMQKVREDVQKLNQTPPTEFNNSCKQIELNISKIKQEMNETATTGSNFFNNIGGSIKGAFSFMSGAAVIYKAADAIRQIPKAVTDVDSSLVELNKVANLSETELESFLDTAYKLGDGLAKTGQQVSDATTEFVKAGYSVSESTKLANDTLLSMNVGSGMENNLEGAASSMIAVLKGFKMEANKSNEVVDKMAKTADTCAVSYSDLSSGIERSSSVMNLADVEFEQGLGMLTSVFEITRNMEKSSTGLNTVITRMRGVKESGEEDVEMLGKVQNALKDIANVNLMDSQGQLRNTFDVLSDLNKVWDSLSKNQKALLNEKLAGNRQSVILSSLMQNWQAVDKTIQSTAESTGYAQEVNERFMNSVEGKMSALKSSWQQLAIDTLSSETLKNLISLTNEVVKLIDACGGLVPVILSVTAAYVGLKVAQESVTKGSVASGIGSLIKKFIGLKTATDATTVATVSLGVAQKLLIGGAIVAGVMGVAYAIKYIGDSSKRAREHVEALSTEIKELSANRSQAETLAKQYDELNKIAKAQKLTNEQQEDFTRIQNELKDVMPQTSGYIDEQGNFIVTETDLVEKLNKVYDELIEKKKQEKSDTAKSVISKDISDYDKAIKKAEEWKQKQKSLLQYKSNGNKYDGVDADSRYDIDTLIQQYGNLENAIGVANARISESNYKSSESLKNVKQDILDVVYNTEEWSRLSESQAGAISKFITNADSEDVRKYVEDIKSGRLSVSDFISEISKVPSVSNDIKNSIESQKNGWDKASGSAEGYAKSLDEIKNKYDETINSISDLSKLQSELSKNGGLSPESISNIISNYKDLIPYLDDAGQLQEKLNEKIAEQEKAQNNALNQMLANDSNYYQQKILMNTDWVNNTQNQINSLFKQLGIEYQADLSNYSSMEQAKAGITEDLINSLGAGWQRYFDKTSGALRTQSEFSAAGNGWSGADYAKMAQAQSQAKQQVDKIASIFGSYKFEPVKISAGKISGGGGGRGGSSKSSSEKYASYITQGIDDAIKEIKEKGDLISTEIEFLDKKIANATTKGDETLIQTLSDKRTVLQSKLPEVYHQSAEELRKLQSNLIQQLQKSNLPELKNMDLAKLTESELNKVIRIYEQKAEQAGNKGNNKLKASYEVQKGLLQEAGNGIVEINKDITSLQQSWWDKTNESLESAIENIKRVKDAKDRLIDADDKNIEVGLILTNDTSDEYYNLMQRKQDNLLKHQQNIEEALSKLRKKGTLEESQEIRELKDSWYDYEKQRIEMAKQRGEAIRENRLKELNRELSDTKDGTSSITSLLSLVKEMIKQETSEKSEELKKQTDNRKNALNEQYNAEKDALNKRLALLREEADKRKKALQEESSERSYQQELSEKQKKYTDTYNAIQGLQGDNRLSTVKKRKELEAQLANYKKELDDLQYKHSVEMQEKAIDDKLEMQEKELENQLDNLENNHDKELKALDDLYNKQIKKLEDRIKTEGKLQEEAMKLIDNKNSDLYKRLEKYALEYTSMTRTEVTNIWEKGYDAIDKYDGRQKGVLNTLESLISKTNEYAESIKKIEDAKSNDSTNWKDYVDEKDYSSNSKEDSSGGQDNSEIRDIVDKMKQNSALYKLMDTKEKKKIYKQRNEDLAKGIDGAWKESDGVWYIKKNGKKKRLYDVYHNGIENGEIGSKTFTLKQNEQMAKLATKEIVLNPTQTRNVVDNFNNLSGGSTTVGDVNVTLQIAADRIDRSSLPFIRDMITEEVPRAIQMEIVKMGTR